MSVKDPIVMLLRNAFSSFVPPSLLDVSLAFQGAIAWPSPLVPSPAV